MSKNSKTTAKRRHKNTPANNIERLHEQELKLMARAWLVIHGRELEPDPRLEAEAISFFKALKRFDEAIGQSGLWSEMVAPIIVAYYGEDYVADNIIDKLKELTVNRGLFKQHDLLEQAREKGRREARVQA